MSESSRLALAARIGRSFGWLVLGRLATVFATLAFLALVTRHLGPDGYGQFRTAQAWLGFVYLLANLGLPGVLLREMGTAGCNQAQVLAAALGLRLVTAILLFLAGLALVLLLPWDRVVALAVLGGTAGFIALSLFDTLTAVFRERLSQSGQLSSELAAALVLLAGGGVVVWQGGGVVAFSLVLSLSLLLQLLVAWRAASAFLPVRLALDVPRWRSLLKAALPLAVTNLLTLLYYRADTVILSLLRPPLEVGIYGIASRLLDTAVGLAILFVSLLTPQLAARCHEPSAFRRLLGHGIDAVAVGGGAIVLGLAVFGGDVAALIGGPTFAAAALPAAVLAFTFWCASMSLLLRYALLTLDQHGELMPGYALAVVLACVAYALLIPGLGATGAAIGTLVGESCVMLWTARALARLKALPDRRGALLRVAAALAAGALTGLALRLVVPWPLACAAAVLVYLCGLTLSGLFDRQLLGELLRAVRSRP